MSITARQIHRHKKRRYINRIIRILSLEEHTGNVNISKLPIFVRIRRNQPIKRINDKYQAINC